MSEIPEIIPIKEAISKVHLFYNYIYCLFEINMLAFETQ